MAWWRASTKVAPDGEDPGAPAQRVQALDSDADELPPRAHGLQLLLQSWMDWWDDLQDDHKAAARAAELVFYVFQLVLYVYDVVSDIIVVRVSASVRHVACMWHTDADAGAGAPHAVRVAMLDDVAHVYAPPCKHASRHARAHYTATHQTPQHRHNGVTYACGTQVQARERRSHYFHPMQVHIKPPPSRFARVLAARSNCMRRATCCTPLSARSSSPRTTPSCAW